MWIPFEPDMLNDEDEIVINCRTEEGERFVARLMDQAGITYPDGVSVSSKQCWLDGGFYYRVFGGKTRRGMDVTTSTFGPTCLLTYIDAEINEIEISDAGFESVICAGGVKQGGSVDG